MYCNASIENQLKEAGMDSDMLRQYIAHQRSGSRNGQINVIMRCRWRKHEELESKRAQLSRLDYLIAELEGRI